MALQETQLAVGNKTNGQQNVPAIHQAAWSHSEGQEVDMDPFAAGDAFGVQSTGIFNQTTQEFILQVDDVVATHRTRNKANKPPNLSRLQGVVVDQVSANLAPPTSSPDSSTSGNSSPLTTPSGRAPRYSITPRGSKPANEDTLGYYSSSLMWQGVIKESATRYDLHIAIRDGFPDSTHDKHVPEEIIQKVIVERNATADTRFQYTDKMCTIVLGQRAGLRGKIKEVARHAVKSVFSDVFFDSNKNPRDAALIKVNVRQLLLKAEWTHGTVLTAGGEQAKGRFVHPCIKNVILEFFYTKTKGVCLGALYPEEFRSSVPIRVAALAIAAISCALEEYKATGKRTTVMFTSGGFGPSYNKTVETMTELCAGISQEGIALKTSLRQWAQQGMELMKDGNDSDSARRAEVYSYLPVQD